MTLSQLSIGLLFLLLTNASVAIPFSIFIKRKPLAVLLSVAFSTLVLKTWAYFSIGSFDIGFVFVLLATGLTAAISVKIVTDSIRKTA